VKKIIQNFDEYLLMAMLAFSTTLIFLQVIMRYVFGYSLSWSEELARYLYVWQTWLSAGYAVKKRRHLRVTSLVDLAKGVNRVLIELFVLLLWLGFSIFLGFKSAELCVMIHSQGQTSTAMGLPMWIPYLAVPAGAFFMAYQVVLEFLRFFRELRLARG
jgi:TRAP-type C4-dicarboxylate transport system permease small subunit